MDSLLNLDEHTCRTCLNTVEVTNSLFDCVQYEARVELKEILWRLSNIVINPNEGIQPTRICPECTEKLLDAYDFLIKVEHSERRLTEHFENVKKLAEQNDLLESVEVQSEQFAIIDDGSQGPMEDDFDYENIVTVEMQFHRAIEEAVDEETGEQGNEEAQVVDIKSEICEKEESENPMECYITSDVSNNADIKTEPPSTEVMVEEKLFEENGENTLKVQPKSNTQNQTVQTDLPEPPFQCATCGRVYAKHETLIRHQKAHMGTGTFQCNHCARSFTRKDNLLRHMATHKANNLSSGSKKNSYKHGLCPFCGESFPQASLIIHIRRHTGEKPYKCDICGQGYPRSQDLMIHKRSHTGEKPHLCNTCGKAFSRPNKLARHIRVHTGERPYKCNQCNKAFAQSNDLNLHIRRHTGEKPYKCGVCGECFINGTALKNHRKSSSHYGKEGEEERRDRYEKIRVTNPHRPCWRTKIPGPQTDNEKSVADSTSEQHLQESTDMIIEAGDEL